MNNLILDLGQIASIIAMTIAVTKGITSSFNVNKGIIKQLITVVVAMYLLVNAVMIDNEFIAIANTVIVILFGAFGIYNFIPVEQNAYGIEDDTNDILEVDDNGETL